MISQRSITLILETANIVEVIGEYVRLKRAGSNHVGLCPFHNEKTPSFNVSPARGIYKCFGCGAAGNVTKFLMDHEHYSYPEALRHLAEKYHLEIEEIKSERPEDKAEENLKESMMVANGFAQKFYSETLLNTDDGKAIGLSYFTERGFRDDTVKKFQLGFSPKSEDAFSKAALEGGYNEDILRSAGLVSERGGRRVDFFRDRVMFPIHNFSGRVIGFGGRILTNEKTAPKYVNTPQSLIYDKSKTLYGIFFAKSAIRKHDECILVEGYTDVISLSQAGIENVVASSGTSLTPDQAKLIKRMTQNVTILYDGDPAGLKAAFRGVDLILEEDINVKVVILPEGEDPDSLVKSRGAAGLTTYIKENVKDFVIFKATQLKLESEGDPVKRAESLRELATTISIIPEAFKRNEYVRICSEAFDLNEQILISEINKLKRTKFSREAGISRREAQLISPDAQTEHDQRAPDYQKNFDLQEKDVIRLLLEYGTHTPEAVSDPSPLDICRSILADLSGIPFENPLYNKILSEFSTAIEKEAPPALTHFTHHPEKEISDFAIDTLYSPYQISPNWYHMHDIVVTDKRFLFRQDIRSSMVRFKLKTLTKWEEDCRNKLKEMKDETEVRQNMEKLNHFHTKRKELANDLGTVVMR